MALFIMTFWEGVPHEHLAYIGENLENIETACVEEVKASGNELERIRSWGNFPNTLKSSQRYFGDQAKFIVGNWH